MSEKVLSTKVSKENWDEPCFGSEPRDDEPKKKDSEVDEIVYRK